MSMTIAPGSTSVSLRLKVVDDDGLPVTGLDHTTFPAMTYHKLGAATVLNVTPAALASLDAAWTSGGIRGIGSGDYRFDAPNAMFSTEATVVLAGEETGKRVIVPTIEVKYADVDMAAFTALGAVITLTSPVNTAEGTLEVFRTDDYNSTTGQQVSYTVSGWPAFPSNGVKLRISRDGSLLSFGEIATTVTAGSGSDQVLTADLTVAQVALLRYGSLDDFRFEVTYGDGSKATPVYGKMHVVKVGA